MKVYFKVAGKYVSGTERIVVSDSDVKSKRVFAVADSNVNSYIDVGKAVRADAPDPVVPDSTEFGKEEVKEKPKAKTKPKSEPKEAKKE